MPKLAGRLTLVMLLALAAAMASAQDIPARERIPAVAQSQFAPLPDDIRDYRYCEVIPVFRARQGLHVEVYNTLGLNDCPADRWDGLDAAALAETFGALEIKLNGPRFWVINQVVGAGLEPAGKTVAFGGIEMTMRATIETRLGQGTVGSQLYTENAVRRSTTFTYLQGSAVYELTSPAGAVYRMQSYTQMVDPALSIADLASLGQRLQLPPGWRYDARVLSENSLLTADGLAYVINDEFGNSYQKIVDAKVEQSDRPTSPLEWHAAYWVAELEVAGLPAPLTVVNDMHVDPASSRVTVYAQSRLSGQIISPPQVGPGECAATRAGDTVCFHPNAVYLNGSGDELLESDGAGEWWVKHAWILGGEGYLNCALNAKQAYDDCLWVEGDLLADGLTMKIGGIEPEQGFNIRRPLLDKEPVAYQVTQYRIAPDAAGESTPKPAVHAVLTFSCIDAVSALDNQQRGCPGDQATASQARK